MYMSRTTAVQLDKRVFYTGSTCFRDVNEDTAQVRINHLSIPFLAMDPGNALL